MKYWQFRKIKLQAHLCSLFRWNEFRYPQPVNGRFHVPDTWVERMKWCYKSWIRQVERAEKDSGIETFFRKQDLGFSGIRDMDVLNRMKIATAGDFMAVDCLTCENTPNLFDDIRSFYFNADIVCGNLESTVYDQAPLGRNQPAMAPPRMNTSVGMLERFLDNGRGVNFFSTANNHCYDYGEEGLTATLEHLERRGCAHAGTNRSPQDQADVPVIERNGIRVAMPAYTYDLNGNTCEKSYLINEVRFNDEEADLSLVSRHIEKAREKGADIIIASVHWGWEFEMYPHTNIIEAAHRMIEMGIDVILGHHPHVSQPMERYVCRRNGRTVEGLILYSLGDFVSYHPATRNSKITYVASFDLVKGAMDGEVRTVVSNLRVLPVYIMTAKLSDDRFDCRLLRFRQVLSRPQHYPLTRRDGKDLKHLNRVLYGILLPERYNDLVEEDG